MEALNLNTLASSLQSAKPANLVNAEKDLLNSFKAAALSITTLYRSSRHTSKRAFNAGYSSACQDLLMMIQQGVSVGGVDASGSNDSEGGGLTIGKVMDWIEARLDAIKAREEEEDEDEEREKERERGKASTSAATKSESGATKVPISSTAGNVPARPKDTTNPTILSQPPSPSPPPATTLRPIHYPQQPMQRHSKPRATSKDKEVVDCHGPTFASAESPFHYAPVTPTPTNNSFPENDSPIPIAAGAKRRHAVMMMLDSAASPVSISTSSPQDPTHTMPPAGNGLLLNHGLHTTVLPSVGNRRRTRNSRSVHQHNHNQNLGLTPASEAMDVEEDSGRERKRVARR